MDAELAVIVLNWNGWKSTIDCLTMLEQVNDNKLLIVVLDNGSTDKSFEHLNKWSEERWKRPIDDNSALTYVNLQGKKIIFLKSVINLGFAEGVNSVLRFIVNNVDSIKYCMLLNNDVRIDKDFFENILAIGNEVKAPIVGAVVKDYEGRKVIYAKKNFPSQIFKSSIDTTVCNFDRYWETAETDGCAMLITRELIEQIFKKRQYFLDPQLFLYGEETELCRYVWKMGYRCVVARDAVAYHKLSHSSGGAGNPLPYYYITRNRVYLAKKLLTAWQKLLFNIYYPPSRLIRALTKFLKGEPKVASAILQGVCDGYLNKLGLWKRHGG